MKRAAVVFVFVFIFITVLLGAVLGAATRNSQDTGRIEQSYGIQSCSIAYCEGSEVTFQNYGDGINEKSVFELASNGKTVSAYLILKMVEEGKIHLDDKIAPFLDDNLLTDDPRMNDITVRQLLCHTAGFSPSFELGIDREIYADPGEEFCYSGVGYIYLQNVIENVSGMSIEEAAEDYVFEPLGMNNSTFAHTKTVTPYMKLSAVTVYIFVVFVIVFIVLLLLGFVIGKTTKCRFFSDKGILSVCFVIAGMINTLFLLFVVSKAVVIFESCFAWMGLVLLLTRKNAKLFYAVVPVMTALMLILGFTIPMSIPVTNDIVAREANCAYTFKSTSEDMSLFCQELMRQYLSGDGAVKDMFSDAVVIDPVNGWGLGIAIEAEREGKTYWHSGINPGFQSLFVLYPSQDKYIIILTNSDSGLLPAKETASAFLEVDGKWEIPR